MAHAADYAPWLAVATLCAMAVAARMLAGALRRLVLLGDLPRPSHEHWLLGSLHQMLHPRQHLLLAAWAAELGSVFTFRILFTRVVVVTDGALANVVLGRTLSLDKALEPDLSDELLSIGGHRTMFSAGTRSAYWRLLRKGTADAFSPRAVREAFPDTLRILSNIVENMHRGGASSEWDLNNVLLRFAMDMTSIVVFGEDAGATSTLQDSETDGLFSIMKRSLDELTQRCVNPVRRHLFWRADVRNGANEFWRFRAAMQDLVKKVKARGPVRDSDHSIAAHLLRIKDPETGAGLSDDLLAGDIGMFFTAGLETSGNQITWILYLVSQHTDVEAKLAAELDAAGLLTTKSRPQPRTLQHADLSCLPYLSCVCKEAMRFAPVAATGTTRIARQAMMLGGYFIPRGSILMVPFHAVHHSTANFGRTAGVFNPDRWMTTPTATAHVTLQDALETAKDVPSPGESGDVPSVVSVGASTDATAQQAYMPFSTGPRRCLGQPLALQMQLAAVAVLCARFRFELAERMGGPEGVGNSSINRLTLQPKDGMWMRCFPRASGKTAIEAQ